MMRYLPLTFHTKMLALMIVATGVVLTAGLLITYRLAPSEGADIRQAPSDQDRVIYQRVRLVQGGNFPTTMKTPTGVIIEQFAEVIRESWYRIDENNLVIEGHEVFSTPDGRIFQEGMIDRTGKVTERTIWDREISAFRPRELGQLYKDPDTAQVNKLEQYLNDSKWIKIDENEESMVFRQVSTVTEDNPYGVTVTHALDRATGRVVRTTVEQNTVGGFFLESVFEAFAVYDLATVEPKVWEPYIR
ncbi:MAG: hypothetical protein HY532_07565 [Chloroflexi bacterium]|nr:hypothetical protein [Chloroflexota bacterium]